jgi:general secretion pathway protein C
MVESAASHFKLMGVVANRAHGGYALISVDGKPARPYQVGAALNDSLMLQSVAARSAALAARADGPVAFTLEMPVLASAPSTATAPASAVAAAAPAPETAAGPTPVAVRQRRTRSAGSNSE